MNVSNKLLNVEMKKTKNGHEIFSNTMDFSP